MAESPQHPLQIMENQTRYDLNAAIENWRNELAAQPNLASDDRRELEIHLRDTISELRQRGLNDEESFWLARHRVGQPQKLAEEFVKENPAKVWRERLFWMIIALLALNLWGGFCSSITALFTPHENHTFQLLNFLRPFLNVSLFIFFAVFVLRGWTIKNFTIKRAWNFLFFSRLHFVIVATILVVAVNFLHFVLQMAEMQHYSETMGAHLPPGLGKIIFSSYLFENSLWPIMLIVLAAWLMIPQNRKIPKHA
ncbi:MAG TPA: permease prefix domain 1-containing protein [Verrucomicrobiae bacterium]|nr:permease prefix domain 1-containing protein [Verrucomicrobiae bacterium]